MRYTLPESLGSREAEATGPVTGATVEVVLVDTPEIRVTLPVQWLTEVKPPLPEEPPVGAYRVGGVLCMRVSPDPGKCWVYQTKDEMFSEETFADLCSDFGTDIVPLVPDPFAEPVALPWKESGKEAGGETAWDTERRPWSVEVELTTKGMVLVSASVSGRGAGIRLYAGTAREMARALMAAADAAEKEQS